LTFILENAIILSLGKNRIRQEYEFLMLHVGVERTSLQNFQTITANNSNYRPVAALAA